MAWNLALGALASVVVLAALLALVSPASKREERDHPIENYLLAGGSLGRSSVVSLLLSSSFGLNSLFYQVWLGFTVGAWGLVAQGAWALSFVLLAPFSSTIRSHKSLHELLGERFGFVTRVVAGVCSLFGIMYLMGWEAEVSRATIDSMLSSSGGMSIQEAAGAATWLTSGIVFGCLMYTVLGGLKGNAVADLALNLVKLITVCFLTILLLPRFAMPTGPSFWGALLPSFETMRDKLGLWGLTTNIAFSVVWQFVDTSSWQSIIAGAEKKEGDTAWNLRWSGIAVFVAPGIIGTLLGMSMVGAPDITSENILAKLVTLAPSLGGVVVFAVFVMIMACVLSMLDGLFLATTFTFVVDILHPHETFASLEADSGKAERLLLVIRIALIGIAIAAIWGVKFFLAVSGLSLFDFVYVVIITQLALFGPVLITLTTHREARFPAWLPICLALVVGFGAVIVGTTQDLKWVVDGAGAFTILVSWLATYAVTKATAGA